MATATPRLLPAAFLVLFLLSLDSALSSVKADSPSPSPSPSSAPSGHSPTSAPSPSPLSPSSPSPSPSPNPSPGSSPSPSPSPPPVQSPPSPPSSPVKSTPSPSVESPPPPSSGHKSHGLSGGQKAGITIGVIVAVGLIGVGAFVCAKRSSNIQRSQYGYATRGGMI